MTDSHHTVHYRGEGHLLLRPDFTCTGSDTITSTYSGSDTSTLRHGMVNVPWGAPGGSGRRAPPRVEAGPPGIQPLPRVLELAASKVADFIALAMQALCHHHWVLDPRGADHLHAAVRPAPAHALQVRVVARRRQGGTRVRQAGPGK